MFAYTICRFTYHYVCVIVQFLKELLPFLTEEFLSNENSSKLCMLGYCLLPYADLYMLVWWDYCPFFLSYSNTRITFKATHPSFWMGIFRNSLKRWKNEEICLSKFILFKKINIRKYLLEFYCIIEIMKIKTMNC